MLDIHDERTITANVDEVLDALRANLAEHKAIVKEAKDGYSVKCHRALLDARKTLNKRLAAIKEGKDVEMNPISFRLSPPQDHCKEFDTIIKMLELHKTALDADPSHKGPATIELKASDVQRFVLNNWSWQEQFLAANSVYSGKAERLYHSGK